MLRVVGADLVIMCWLLKESWVLRLGFRGLGVGFKRLGFTDQRPMACCS